ncbi:hypothetical protein ACFWIJ_44185, partial [Streptomyces sp. NPDC127079]|uniref:hypothetical protein n=1 Tax=Streptomyces sp. NPDC127079 TaxID=3347132 RepID=UPI0036508D3F
TLLRATAGRVAERARSLHTDAVAAYDARPGARQDLDDRLDAMIREQRHAAERLAQLGRALGAAHSRQEAEALNLDLAWAHDDHERALARCAELRARLARLDAAGAGVSAPYRDDAGPPYDADAPGGARHGGDGRAPRGDAAAVFGDDAAVFGDAAGAPRVDDPAPPRGAAADASYADVGSEGTLGTPAPTPAPASTPAPAPAKQRKRRRGSARFAGMAVEEAAPSVVPRTPEPPAVAGGRGGPRGARFAGAAETPVRPVPPPVRPDEDDDEDARTAVTAAVARLVPLRAAGRTGEAHALLAEVAQWPAGRFPLLADALQAAGLGADWATLLWETASLPPARLVPVADALTGAGRTGEARQILRQGVVRPATEIGEAVLALDTAGRHREATTLLDAYVQVRTPEEAAHSAEPDPHRLVPLLLRSARQISEQHHRDLLHALRVAGLSS